MTDPEQGSVPVVASNVVDLIDSAEISIPLTAEIIKN